MGLGGGVECGAHNGYHTRDADLLFEVVDPATGERVRDGEWGEVVFSTLNRRGMPLVRYRTGDRGRFLAGPCPCGSRLKRLDRISGRLGEAVRLHGGSRLSIAQLDDVLYRNPGVSAYGAEMVRRDGCDFLVLTVKPVKGTAPDIEKIVSGLRRLDPVGSLVDRGRLRLDVRTGVPEYFTTGAAKRLIDDKRRQQPGTFSPPRRA
jgi:phenylacetate-coenzyme A ligase PaaK-like adenylate-forming protein